MVDDKKVSSIENLISSIKKDYGEWKTKTFPWFRGEPLNTEWPLLPKLFRPKEDGTTHRENRLLQNFRLKAPTLGNLKTPPRDGHTDQWLFLAQHVGLPTRLLDWSEGLLIALHFALLEKEPVLWMLNPMELNRKTVKDDFDDNVYPLSWVPGPNIGNWNFQRAWGDKKQGTDLPVAIPPTHIFPRMSAQKSCFTIHGKQEQSLSELVGPVILKKYIIDIASIQEMKRDLRIMGFSDSALFPDLDGLARDLSEIF